MQVLTLRGTGDLVLHEGALHIQPPVPGPSQNAFWHKNAPPEALTVSRGSLAVYGGGAEISSTRANAPALAVSVGAHDNESEDGFAMRQAFSYSGVAFAVNVREETPMLSNRFRLFELALEGSGVAEGEQGEEGLEADPERVVLLSVRGDGKVSLAGGGGVVLGEGDLEVSRGNASFKVGGLVKLPVCRISFFLGRYYC